MSHFGTVCIQRYSIYADTIEVTQNSWYADLDVLSRGKIEIS